MTAFHTVGDGGVSFLERIVPPDVDDAVFVHAVLVRSHQGLDPFPGAQWGVRLSGGAAEVTFSSLLAGVTHRLPLPHVVRYAPGDVITVTLVPRGGPRWLLGFSVVLETRSGRT